MARSDKHRMSIEFDVQTNCAMERGMELSGATSKAEVLRRSVRLFKIVTEAQADGGRVFVEGPDGSVERLVVV